MNVLIKRKMALGDVIMLTGVIREIVRKHKDDYVYFESDYYDILKVLGFSTVKPFNSKETYNKVYDFDLCYEKDPWTPAWEAYANYAFGENNYNREDITPRNKVITIHAGKSSDSRTLSKEKWQNVINYLKDKGYYLITIGKEKDFTFEGIPNLDKLSYQAMIDIISYSRLFIGLDSGIMHIAQLTNTPIVGIFSICDPYMRIWRKEQVEVVEPSKGVCRFCLQGKFKDKAPVTCITDKEEVINNGETRSVKCDDNYECINSITPEQIIISAEAFL